MDIGRETINTDSYKLLLYVFQFIGISRHNGIRNNRGVFKLIYNVKYGIYMVHSK
jgi:hypothetical protein